MSEEFKTVQNRRDFVKTAAKVAVTAPAAAMLLNASVVRAQTVSNYGDDFGHIVGTNTGDDNADDVTFVTNAGDDYVP